MCLRWRGENGVRVGRREDGEKEEEADYDGSSLISQCCV